jgi:broad specificity phosphatase PhoE
VPGTGDAPEIHRAQAPFTRLFLIRHADVENPQRVLYGHLPNFRLSALGRAQSMAIGERLKPEGVSRIVHSPLERARETAELIAQQLSPPPVLVSDYDLREAEFSRYLQGVPYWQVPMRRPLWFVHKARRGLLPGDETIEALGGRVLRVARLLARAHPGETMALVSHADPLNAAWILLDGRPQNERELHRKSVGKAGMLQVEMEGDQPKAWEYIPPPDVGKPASAAA